MDMKFLDIKFVANLLYYINFKTFPFIYIKSGVLVRSRYQDMGK